VESAYGVCSQYCSSDATCPGSATCDAMGMCICQAVTPQCWYGSCILDSECTPAYGSGTYCDGPFWPFSERYCSKDCGSDIECVSVFGPDAICQSGSCRCND